MSDYHSDSSNATDSSEPLKWHEFFMIFPFSFGSLLICCLIFIVMVIYDQSLFSFSNVALINLVQLLTLAFMKANTGACLPLHLYPKD